MWSSRLTTGDIFGIKSVSPPTSWQCDRCDYCSRERSKKTNRFPQARWRLSFLEDVFFKRWLSNLAGDKLDRQITFPTTIRKWIGILHQTLHIYTTLLHCWANVRKINTVAFSQRCTDVLITNCCFGPATTLGQRIVFARMLLPSKHKTFV